jgi:ATP-dependent exoDNAse (exonuclease V) beta subunit
MFQNIIFDESIEAYHASEGLSASGLKLLYKSARHFQIKKNSPPEDRSKPNFGSLVHLALEDLTLTKFKNSVKAIEGHRGKTETKEKIAEAVSQGFLVCKPEEYDGTLKIVDGLFENKSVRNLIESGGVNEASLRFKDENGIIKKCRPDRMNPDLGFIIDYKTFSDLDIDNVEREIHRKKYHWQSAWYLDIFNAIYKTNSKNFVHIFIDSESYVARPFVLGDASLDKAREEITPIYELYKRCLEKNEWPGYPDGIVDCELPHYAWKEL